MTFSLSLPNTKELLKYNLPIWLVVRTFLSALTLGRHSCLPHKSGNYFPPSPKRSILAKPTGVFLVLCLIVAPLQAQQRGPKLYLVSCGVSQYQHPKINNLKYAAKDAEDLANFFSAQEGKMFSGVEKVTLTDRQATSANILDSLRQLRGKVSADSYTIVFLSGHGGQDTAGNYYYVPHDFDPQAKHSTVVTWQQLRSALNDLPGLTFLILDTCFAGGAAPGGNSDSPTNLGTGPMPVSSLITFASSMANQTSAEDNNLRNGLFTSALLEALSGKADMLPRDGILTVAEVDAYVSGRVKELSRGRQFTTMDRPARVPSCLPMAKLTGPSIVPPAQVHGTQTTTGPLPTPEDSLQSTGPLPLAGAIRQVDKSQVTPPQPRQFCQDEAR